MKRFWKQAEYERVDGGFQLRLDGRDIRTPARAPLVVPTAALADAVAGEWNAVEEKLDPAAMPMSGLANAAIDRIAVDRDAFIEEITAFANSDLLCYRAESPRELAERQAGSWDSILDWARGAHGTDFVLIEGIVHQPQPAGTIAAIGKGVAARSDFELAALSRLTSLSGSAVASLALAEGALDAKTVWQASIIDELWQEEQWGVDDIALGQRAARAAEFLTAARFLALSKQS